VSEGTRHQFGLPVSAFLGGISFTIMAFLIEMQTDNKFHYPMIDDIPNFMELSELVIAGLAVSGTFFIVSSIGMIPVASGRIGELSPLARC
jgi:ABC-type Fe3+-siderophore transport system permease subunit